MPFIELHIGERCERIPFSGEIPLSSVTAPYGLPMPCGGHHTCGKCKIKAVGALSPITPEETRLLTQQELSEGIRMACSAAAVGDCTVYLPETSRKNNEVLLTGAQRQANADGWGIAVDIGTTTIAVYACHNGQIIRSAGQMNGQSVHGADVITRIGAKRHLELQKIVVEQLSQMFMQVLGDEVAPEQVEQITITGNTTMLHFLMGLDPSSIAVSPFTPQSLFGEFTPASQLFPAFQNARLYLPPCVSAYVGADMVCAITASQMCEKKETSLLADIGTNGEMALYHEGKLVTCSTAAGPALEGACIHNGMAAAPGAIDRVSLDENGNLVWHTIDNVPAKGLCGSGLISLIAQLVETGGIDETGVLTDPVDAPDGSGEDCVLIGDSGVFLTQQDIRQVQLAKAAICAGILTMLEECEQEASKVDVFYICGGFGSYIDPHAAAVIGLFPPELENKVQVLGNAAGSGAVMMLDAQHREIATNLQGRATLIELSTSPVFMEQYIEQMCFGTA